MKFIREQKFHRNWTQNNEHTSWRIAPHCTVKKCKVPFAKGGPDFFNDKDHQPAPI